MKKTVVVTLCVLVASAIAYWALQRTDKSVDFNTQVKPILNKRCISCHGGVKREGDFSLLFPQEALAVAESGKRAIVPGDVANSELVRRIMAHDPEKRMPYKKEPLPTEEIEILTRWIEQGAPWGDHWAYQSVRKQARPTFTPDDVNEIDAFVSQKRIENKLPSTPKAPDEILLRRVALDIIGIPANEDLEQKFLDHTLSYEALVDSLLNSPHYGERWAAVWMDLARYADTKGYERDDRRTIWRYRDWLINAFNRDMPYDSFLIEQLAGDLLPNPTDEQYIATAFHRNTMTNDEGGTENEEYRTAAVLDRVNTTWEALMGTTFACVQCHSHPYDPFKHDEYYKFAAFFNNTRDEDTYDDYPVLRHFEKEDEAKLKSITEWIEQRASKEKARSVYQLVKMWEPTINSIQADQFTNSELTDTKWLIFRNNTLCRLPNVELTNRPRLLVRLNSFKPNGVWTIHVDKPEGPVLATIQLPTTTGWQILEFDLKEAEGKHDLVFTYTNKNLTKPEDSGVMFDWFYFTDFATRDLPDKNQQKDFWTLLTKEVETTPVMMENPDYMRRTSQVFERGNWLVKGDTVQPEVPASLSAFPKDASRDRLGLARWMTSKEHPLTSRTIVNRVWEQIFGLGLVETLEDMGTQGIPPTHPELLDHLAYQLMNDYQWSLKKLIRTIVLSRTYQQDSKLTPELLEKDPQNKFYARGPRVRLSAEQVRDQALAVSGLLSNKIYGPSVMPYQPDGIWLSPWNGATWIKSEGEDQHRRAVYTYWKRTAPYPSMMTFDGTAREVCTARRIRTNTPLQALVTLNDSVYVEAANHLAMRMKKASPELKEQIAFGFRKAIGRAPSPEVIAALEKLHHTISKTKIEAVRAKEQRDPITADDEALMLVANAILNLDEFVTKN